MLACAFDGAISTLSTELGKDKVSLTVSGEPRTKNADPRPVTLATRQFTRSRERGGTVIPLRINRPLFGAISAALREGDALTRSLAHGGRPSLDLLSRSRRTHGTKVIVATVLSVCRKPCLLDAVAGDRILVAGLAVST